MSVANREFIIRLSMAESGKSDDEVERVLKRDRDFELWLLACSAQGRLISIDDQKNWLATYAETNLFTSEIVVALYDINDEADCIVSKPRTRGRTPRQAKQDTIFYCNELVVEIGRYREIEDLINSKPVKPIFIDSKAWVSVCITKLKNGDRAGALFFSPKLGKSIHFIMSGDRPGARCYLKPATLIAGIERFKKD